MGCARPEAVGNGMRCYVFPQLHAAANYNGAWTNPREYSAQLTYALSNVIIQASRHHTENVNRNRRYYLILRQRFMRARGLEIVTHSYPKQRG